MKRRQFFTGAAGALLAGRSIGSPPSKPLSTLCGCALAPPVDPLGSDAFRSVGSRLKITNMKVFGVSLTPDSDRPFVFVKLETDAGIVGWGEGTLEGKASAVMACMNDFRDFVIGADPMQVEHHWQSMYVQSFYRAGPVMGSAISGIDQAMWDIRGKALGLPVYQLLGGPFDARGVRGYYHVDGQSREQLEKLRPVALQIGVSCFKTGIPGYYEWIETNRSIDRAVKSMQMVREALGPDIDIAVDFHAKTSPSVAAILVKEVEPLNLLVHRGAVPAGEREGDGADRAALHHADCNGRDG